MGKLLPESVEIGDDVIFQKLNDEAVVLNLATQDYFSLDNVGTSMWSLLVEFGNLETVVGRLSSVYDVETETLRRDLCSLVQQLVGSGLLKASDQSVDVS